MAREKVPEPNENFSGGNEGKFFGFAPTDQALTDSSRRIHAELRACGYACNVKRVTRLMRIHGIGGKCRRRKKVVTTDSKHDLPVVENVLDQQFSTTAPNQKR